MSCGNPSHSNAEELMPRRTKYDRDKICIKCKENPGNVVIRYVVYCKTCFYAFVQVKFRRALDPSISQSQPTSRGSLKAQGNLCIGITGGIGSLTLLDLVYNSFFTDNDSEKRKTKGLNYPKKGRVWENAIVVYVDQSTALPNPLDRTNDVARLIKQYPDFKFIPLKIEDAFDRNQWDATSFKTSSQRDVVVNMSLEQLPFEYSTDDSSTPAHRLQTFLSSLPTHSSFSTSLAHLTRLLLSKAAAQHDCSHLLLGTTLTSLSIGLISSVSEGGGFHIREEIDEAIGKARVVRPLRDISLKEATLYLWWKGLEHLSRVPEEKVKGIRDITKEFIMGLEREYPSTVSTITRTSAKVTPKLSSPTFTCILCKRPVQPSLQSWKERIAIRDLVSLKMIDRKESPSTHRNQMNVESLTPFLCYACNGTLTSRGTRSRNGNLDIQPDMKVQFPIWSADLIEEDKTRIQDMKAVVNEFLLDDSDKEV